MAEEQISVYNTTFLTPEIEKYIKDECSKCVIVRNIRSKIEESDEEHISASMLMELMATVMIKIGSQLGEISAALMKHQENKHDALFLEVGVPSEVIQQNKDLFNAGEFENIKNPKIIELISNDVNSMKITKYLTSVMEQCFADEISKCKLVRKPELNNEECEEYIPISKIESWVETLVSQFKSQLLEMVGNIITKLEDKYNTNYVKVEAMKEDRTRIFHESKDLLERFENMKKEAKMTQNYDMLTRLDNIRVPKMTEMHRMYAKHVEVHEELNASYEKKRPSIICKFVNRNKKIEMISNRKQLKGKRVDPLSGAAI